MAERGHWSSRHGHSYFWGSLSQRSKYHCHVQSGTKNRGNSKCSKLEHWFLFQWFYYKPVHNSMFAKSVLSATDNTKDMWDWAFWNIITKSLRPQSGWMLFWIIWSRWSQAYQWSHPPTPFFYHWYASFYLITPVGPINFSSRSLQKWLRCDHIPFAFIGLVFSTPLVD